MGKKINLPLVAGDSPPPVPKRTGRKPTIDVARARLGGKPDGDPPARGLTTGQHVAFALASGGQKSGVVIHASSVEVHVLLDSVRLRRFAPDDLVLDDAAPRGELAKIAADARVFGLLAEGQPVRYADDGGELHDGQLIEKCRYGALVLRDDGGIVAVGFRKLWPGAPRTAGEA